MGPIVGTQSSAELAYSQNLLSLGDKGPAVSNVQQLLNQAGANIKVDGDWGPKTDQAVRDFQSQHGLKPDGIVGPKTMAALQGANTTSSSTAAFKNSLDLNKELSSPDSRLSVAIGVAEGTRTPDGSHTPAYNGHADPVKGYNRGTFSYQGKASSPAQADWQQLRELKSAQPAFEHACRKAGLDPSNRLLAGTFFDLYNQSPEAATGKGGLLDQLPSLAKKGITPENLAQARFQSFVDPATGKLDSGMSRNDLKADQKRRTDCLVKVLGDNGSAPKAGDAPPPAQLEAFNHACRKAGLDPANPLLAGTFSDLYKQAPQAATGKGGFLDQLPSLAKKGVTPENITQARIQSFVNPDTGKLEAGMSDAALKSDQKRRTDALAKSPGNAGSAATPPPAGKIGLNSQGPEVAQLKQALKDAGFYHGPINEKMGMQGIDALKQAKAQLHIGGPADVAGTETIKKIQDYAKSTPTLHVPVDFVSQYDPRVPGDNPTQSADLKCDNACEYMMRNTANKEHRAIPGQNNSAVTAFQGGGANDPQVQYIEKQLSAGKPVMIGVNHPRGSTSSNINGINHYLVATGMGVDDKGRRYISFNDPAHRDAALGKDTNPENRLYLENGQFVRNRGWAPFQLRGVVQNQG